MPSDALIRAVQAMLTSTNLRGSYNGDVAVRNPGSRQDVLAAIAGGR